MIDKFNPYATLWPWIRDAPLHPEDNRDDAEDAWATIRDSSDIIDCRHVMVRVAVLRALALRGHPVLFALGNGLKCLRAPLCDHECAAMGDP